jgi:hypothetical protein
MQNINPSKNVNRRGRFYLVMGFLIFLSGLIASALGFLFFLLPLLGESLSDPVGLCLNIVGIPVAIVGIGLAVRGLTLQKDNPLAYEVGESIRSFLGSDARYTFIRNISKRGVGYIDAVLIGPPGALVFRIVNHMGDWINEQAEWRVRTRGGNLRSASSNPTRECARDVYALRAYLSKNRLSKIPVYGVVVFTSDRVKLTGQGPVIPIAEKHTLYQILSRDYLEEERISSPMIRATIDAIAD